MGIMCLNVLKMSTKYCISAEQGTALRNAQMEMIIVLHKNVIELLHRRSFPSRAEQSVIIPVHVVQWLLF